MVASHVGKLKSMYDGPLSVSGLNQVFVLPASQLLPRTASGITSGFTGWSGLMVARAGSRSALVAPKVF